VKGERAERREEGNTEEETRRGGEGGDQVVDV
jgi:hypothetical protein